MSRVIKFRVRERSTGLIFDVESIDFEYGTVAFVVERRGLGRTTERLSLELVELLQYTGLKDKNGVEIYEGDIIAFSPYLDQPHYVSARKAVKWQETKRYTGFNVSRGFSGNQLEHYEVIGNIYENPELLKGSAS